MSPIVLLGWVGPMLGGGGLAVALVLSCTDPTRGPGRWLRGYLKHVDTELRFLRVRLSATNLVTAVLLGALVLGLAGLLAGHFALLLLAVGLLFVPRVLLTAGRSKRRAALEGQLDTWLLTLANALRANPALGEALAASARVVQAPMSDEIGCVLKAHRLGSPLDEGLDAMAKRIGSSTVSLTIAALCIAQRSGGELPRTLETMAECLREAARLEGVLRTKTAEARVQTVAISVLPFVILGLLQAMAPYLLAPLFESLAGHAVLGLALVLWLGAVFSAQRILAVEM